jgi:hypothetical protein
MIRKTVQKFSLLKKVLFFTGLFSLHQNCIMAAIPSLLNKEKHAITAEDKTLQIRVIGIFDAP